MKRALIFAAAAASAAVLLRPEPAQAGSCGGGGGDSSDGGSDSASDSDWSSSDDDSSSPPTLACVDDTDIVGYRRCTKFGGWSQRADHAPVFAELGMAVRTFAAPLGEATGHVTHEDESFSYRVADRPSAGPPPAVTAVVATARVGVALAHGLYLAAAGELGSLTGPGSRAEMMSSGERGTPTITPDATIVAGGLGVVGVRGALGRGALGAELAGGFRTMTYRYTSRYLACVTSTSETVASPILEARARASLWLTPFVNLGVSAGASVIDRGAWVTGLHLGFTTHAFGGQRD